MDKETQGEKAKADQSIYKSVWKAVHAQKEEQNLQRQRDKLVDIRQSMLPGATHTSHPEEEDDIPDEKGIIYDALKYLSAGVDTIKETPRARLPALVYLKVDKAFSAEGWLLYKSADKDEWRAG